MKANSVKLKTSYKLTRHSPAYEENNGFLKEPSKQSNCVGDVVTVIESRPAVKMGDELVSKHLVENARGHWTWVHNYELEEV